MRKPSLHILTWPFVWEIVIWDIPLSRILSLQAIIKVSWVENSCYGLRVHSANTTGETDFQDINFEAKEHQGFSWRKFLNCRKESNQFIYPGNLLPFLFITCNEFISPHLLQISLLNKLDKIHETVFIFEIFKFHFFSWLAVISQKENIIYNKRQKCKS